ncbi:MAG: DnaA/Hda family protein, partial [Defluviitaleaceae bacterium]|nr:DnaA/Hda family protein [Defluviitaleaceae bacterium]
ELDKVEVDSKVIYYIAKSVSSNIRELEGALNTITARAKLTGGPVSLDYAQNALDDMIQVTERHEFGVEYIQEVVGNYMGVSTEEIRSKKRNANITQARHIAMYLSRNLIHKPLKEIGKHFGNRHHSTIIHACDKIAAEIEANEKFSREIAELKRKIKGE